MDLYLVIGMLCLTLVLLISSKFQTDEILLFTVSLFVVFDVLRPEEALSGFTNPGLMTIAALYVVVAGLQNTGAISWLSQALLGHVNQLVKVQFRLLSVAMVLSAFVNNSPVVAIFTSSIQTWVKRTRFHVSQLLMPLSYAAILGGTCTLIGTSTNLVVDGMIQQAGLPGFKIFDMAWVGIPVCIVGLIYLFVVGNRLLPKRDSAEERFENTREYMVEMRVEPGCELIGKSVLEAGLRHLPGLYLIEIIRQHNVFTAVSPSLRILDGDRLVFVGAVESVVELRNIRGLEVATDQSFKVHGSKRDRRLFEAVISTENPVVSQSIRQARFRHRYNAAVLAVARNGRRIPGKVGDIEIKPGDTLLLEAQRGFLFKHQYNREFLLINRLEGQVATEHEKAPIAALVVVGMVLLNLSGLFSIFASAIIASAAMLLSRCVNIEEARKSIDYRLLLTIGMAFGLGVAIQKTGLADSIVALSVQWAGADPHISMLLIYLCTVLLTELVTNNAAAIIMFPVALSAAEALGVSVYPFTIAVMIAASASFITPIGYQTNLMVQGPGGYKYTDYLKLGIPLSILVGITANLLIPWFWSFDAG